MTTEIQGRAVQNLYRAVLCRAVQDALFLRSQSKNSKLDKERAIEYLCGAHESDLRIVCEYAGVSADRIMEVSNRIFANGNHPDLSKYADIKTLKKYLK